jgi:3-methyladenine DNA glycosylase AlkD
MTEIIQKIRQELQKNCDEKTKKTAQNFFKESIKFFGVRNATVHNIGKEYFGNLKDKRKKVIFNYCEMMWQSGFMEESFIACDWSYFVRKQYLPDDMNLFEKWVNNYVTNWASCDTLCNHTVGTLVEMYPAKLEELIKWTKSENRWMRRGAAVSLIVPARKGLFLKEIFEIASLLLIDNDDLVLKGYGWMLKAASEAHQPEVFDFVMKHKSVMPRTALRYAIEKMPAELKRMAMVRKG